MNYPLITLYTPGNRREFVEKAKKYRTSPINKELFATVSPKQDSEDGSVGTYHVEVRFYE